jgi:uncharacterized membrane protein
MMQLVIISNTFLDHFLNFPDGFVQMQQIMVMFVVIDWGDLNGVTIVDGEGVADFAGVV